MESHPYGYETSIFTVGAPHEEVQGRQLSNSEQKEQTNKEKYVFYCSVSQIHKKNKEKYVF